MRPPITTVIFDLDGTLLDTLQDLAESANVVLAELGYPTHPIAAYRTFVGAGVAVLFERALPVDQRDRLVIERCVAGFRDVYGRAWNVHTRPYPGISALLDELLKRRLRCAVLSNKPHDFTVQCVEEYFPDGAFEVVFGARAGVPHKPDPAAVHEILQILGQAPSQCLYLGDSDIDMQTAVAAQLYPVAALWGFRSADELRRAGAATLVKHPEQVLELIDLAAKH